MSWVRSTQTRRSGGSSESDATELALLAPQAAQHVVEGTREQADLVAGRGLRYLVVDLALRDAARAVREDLDRLEHGDGDAEREEAREQHQEEIDHEDPRHDAEHRSEGDVEGGEDRELQAVPPAHRSDAAHPLAPAPIAERAHAGLFAVQRRRGKQQLLVIDRHKIPVLGGAKH
jgi:hypothetical protein